MKNIHTLPTSLPSRLGYLTKKGKEVFKDLRLFDVFMPTILDGENQHIYITNSEEIKEGDWGYCKSRNKICKVTGISKWTHKDDYSIDLDNENYFIHHSYCKKIILTTDQYLIADGVQSIDDEFLEWFVKNTSCEEVDLDTFSMGDKVLYNVVFPQEELKQELIVPSGYYDEDSKDFEIASLVDFTDDEQESIEIMQEAKEMAKEQETIEEVALNFSKQFLNNGENSEYEAQAALIGVKFGANWQAEQNKEYIHKLLDIIQWYDNNSDVRPDLETFEWYEKFKKKA